MAGDSLRPAAAGEAVAPRVSDRRWFDRVTRAAAANDTVPANEQPTAKGRRPGVIKLKSQHAGDVPRYGVLEVGDPVATVASSEAMFNSATPVVKGETPDGSRQLAILLKPARQGGPPVDAVLSGWVQCDVEITDDTHEYAEPASGDVTKLTSSSGNGARILARDPGTGVKRCLVMLGGGGGEHQTIIGAVTTTAAPGTLVLSVTPSARFAALGNPILVLNANTAATRQQGEAVFAVLGTTAVDAAGESVRWVERLGGEATGQLHFVGRLDADLASSDVNGLLTGAESDYGYVGGDALPDPLPTTVGNPHGEAGQAGDRALCFPNPVPAWVAGTDYQAGDRVRAVQPGSSPAAYHEYQAPAGFTSGATFNTAEASNWTDRGETTGEPWVIEGVFNVGGGSATVDADHAHEECIILPPGLTAQSTDISSDIATLDYGRGNGLLLEWDPVGEFNRVSRGEVQDVSAQAFSAGTTNSLAITWPAGVIKNDVAMLLTAGKDDRSQDPAGWTRIPGVPNDLGLGGGGAGTYEFHLYRRRLDAATSGTFNVTWTTTRPAFAILLIFRDVKQVNQFDTQGDFLLAPATDAPARDNSVIYRLGMVAGDTSGTLTPAPAESTVLSLENFTADNIDLAITREVQPTAAAVPESQWTHSSTPNPGSSMTTWTIEPARLLALLHPGNHDVEVTEGTAIRGYLTHREGIGYVVQPDCEEHSFPWTDVPQEE